MDYSSIFVCLMGMGTVFFGLTCLVALVYLMSSVLKKSGVSTTVPVTSPAPVSAAPSNRDEFVAAVSAALAEELGTDITGIRILSIKKV